MEGPLGEFYLRQPDRRELHRNAPGQPLVQVPCHAHKTAHLRFLFAGDAPGPDGRVGWLEKAWRPGAKAHGLPPDIDAHIRGNGPDSVRNIPAHWEHEFTMLSMSGYHICVHFHWEEDENGLRRVPYYTGHLEPTR